MGIKIGNTDISSIKIASGLTPRLPSAYQEVEYIQSSGTQYINTGISAPNGFKAILKVAMVATGGASQTIIGSHNLNSPYGRNNINVFTSGNTWGLHMNDEMINSLGSVVIGDVYEVDGSTILGASYLDVDGVRLTTGNNTSPMSSNNILIFTNQYEVNAHSTFVSAKLYSCMLYNSSYELVRDFVPCYRIADGVIGMYDLVNNQFYTNSGTGTFNKGTDANLPYKEIRKVYKGSTQVRPSGGGGWQPGANTVAYYPLTSDFNDASGNNRNLTNSGATITTLGGLACGYWNGSATTYYQGYSITRDERTISARVNGHMINDNVCVQIAKRNNWLKGSLTVVFYGGSLFIADSYSKGTASYSATADTWYYVVGTQEGSTVKFYLNGNLYDTTTSRPVYQYDPDGWSLGSQDGSGADAKLNGYMSNVILEDKARTAQEVADYYNLTKSNYGL